MYININQSTYIEHIKFGSSSVPVWHQRTNLIGYRMSRWMRENRKCLYLCFEDDWKTYEFGMKWWVKNDILKFCVDYRFKKFSFFLVDFICLAYMYVFRCVIWRTWSAAGRGLNGPCVEYRNRSFITTSGCSSRDVLPVSMMLTTLTEIFFSPPF